MNITCPACGHSHDINIGSILGSSKSAAKTAAARANAKKPRPNARGKKKPRANKSNAQGHGLSPAKENQQ